MRHDSVSRRWQCLSWSVPVHLQGIWFKEGLSSPKNEKEALTPVVTAVVLLFCVVGVEVTTERGKIRKCAQKVT